MGHLGCRTLSVSSPAQEEHMLTKEKLIDTTYAAIAASAVKDKPTKATVERVIDAAFKEIVATLGRGVPAFLPGVGRLSVRSRKATKARNPRTGDILEVPAKKVVRLSAGKTLKEKINPAKAGAGA